MILRAPWLPYAVIAALAVCGGLYLSGYLMGALHAEEEHAKEIVKALDKQRERMLAQANNEKEMALAQQRAKYEIQREISEIPPPSVSCDLPAECLQWGDSVAGTPTHRE